MKVGIIGGGSFGQFMAGVLAPHAEISICSRSMREGLPNATLIAFDDLAAMDVIILAVPLDAHEATLRKLRPLLRSEALVVDVCSVKVKSREIMLRELAGHDNLLICHPLFGPQSAIDGTAGHQLIVTDRMGDVADKVVDFCATTLGLQVIGVTAEEHDRAMAYVHVLTFFVARGLGSMNIADMPFVTPSFQYLQNLITLDHQNSDELFLTVQQGNPFGDEVRRELVQVFEKLEQSLQQK